MGHSVPMLQAKLTVNTPGDKYEQEADRVADMVMRMPDPMVSRYAAGAVPVTAGDGKKNRVQRQCATCAAKGLTSEDCPDCKKKKQGLAGTLQRLSTQGDSAAGMAAPPIVSRVLSSPGSPLPADTRSFMESRFGMDLGHIRIHSDSIAEQSAAAVQAKAYTVGNHIAFGSRSTPRDHRLLAHEITHTIQQSSEAASVQRLSTEDIPAGVAISSQALAASRALFARFAAEAGMGLLAPVETATASLAVAEAELAVTAAIQAGATAGGLTTAGGTGLVAAGGIEVGSAGTGTPVAAVVAVGALVLLGAGATIGYVYRDEIKAAWQKAAELVARAVELIKKALETKPKTETEPVVDSKSESETSTKSKRCSNEEVTRLNTEMHDACNMPRSCNKSDTCETATAKWAAGNSCVRQRTELQQKCFQKGDPGYEEHMKRIAQESAALRNCIEIMSLKCYGKKPEK